MAVDIWAFRATVEDVDLAGYAVAATDGEIGHVDDGVYEDGTGSIIVDTGPLVFGRKVLLPLGTIERVDPEERKVYVDRTKDEIRHAPEYDPSGYADQEYRIQLAEYYARFYG
jgi:hypothetical protein